MANRIYPLFKQAMMTAGANVALNTGTIRVTLVDAADYVYDDAHDFFNDVPSGSRVATAALTNPTVSALGTFDADDVTFPTVTGDPSEALVIWKDTGTEATSRLVAYLDTGIVGLPVTPGGGNVSVTWDALGILTL